MAWPVGFGISLAKHNADDSGEPSAAKPRSHHHEEQIGARDFDFHGISLWVAILAGGNYSEPEYRKPRVAREPFFRPELTRVSIPVMAS